MEFFNIDETFVGAVKNTALGKGAAKRDANPILIYVDSTKNIGSITDDGKTGVTVTHVQGGKSTTNAVGANDAVFWTKSAMRTCKL